MKKFLTPVKVIVLSLFVVAATAFVYYHYTSSRPVFLGKEEEEKEENEQKERFDDPIGRAQYEFDMVKNPATGKIPEGIFDAEMAQARDVYAQQIASKIQAPNMYTSAGPTNLGGRTRSIVYDVRFNGSTNQVIIAGGVSGGIYKSTDNGATWTRKSPTNQLYSVTSIAQDTRAGQENTWYYATGESLGNSASIDGNSFYLGNGIYKSTDNGETWSRLVNSNTSALESFNARQDLIAKVAVDPATGNVYFGGMDGIYRSTDGGASWSLILTSGAGQINSGWVTDIVINSTGTRFYVAFSGSHPFPDPAHPAATLNMPGVWTSTTGASGSWTKIAGATAAASPAGWDANRSYGRVVLALPPSNENLLYAIYDDQDGTAIGAELYRWDVTLGTWTDLSANLPLEGTDGFNTQGGYDLVMSIKPDDANVIFIGGTNVYRSTDGFTSTANTNRIGGYGPAPNSSAIYPNSHPDIHAFAFQPGTPTTMICGNDGGIQRTTNCLAPAANPTPLMAWTHIADGYQTYQYYYVALEPVNGSSKVIGGAQDNGTTRNIGGTGTTVQMILPGDGVSVGLSRAKGAGLNEFWEYGGSQNGNIYSRLSTFSPNSGYSIRPAAATDNGLFVTLFLLDPDNTDTIYYASDSSLYRSLTASTLGPGPGTWTRLNGVQSTIVDGTSPKTRITALATTRGAYNPATASIFIGTNEGRLYRLDDPVNATAATTPVLINGATLPANGYISSVSVNPRNDDTVLVTFSSYGVSSVFWTGNANAATPTWSNVESNISLASFRSSAIAVTNAGAEYYVGTSVGLYRAVINGAAPASTVWAQEGASEIGNAVVSHLVLRTIDNRLLVGTHGIGMWMTTLPLLGLPVNFTSFTGKAEDKQNVLQWEVENEVDNKGYEIERKYKTENSFTKIGFVPAKNANATANKYTFPDKLIDLGIDNVSYRLKQVDIDGKFTYSNTVTLNRKISPRFVEYLSVRPGNLFIRMNGQSSQQVTLRLFDNAGRLLQQKQLQQRTQDVSLAGLPRGVFVVELSAPDGKKFTQRIVH